ncbi:MAG: DUF1311 domain-containing protein [Acidobacteriota bacterium]|nr:DUF1311 domain-containing protein [Acidobacteriota bacterium]
MGAALVSAQSTHSPREKEWSNVCAGLIAPPLSTPSSTHIEPESELEHCDSTALYYGFGHPQDPAAALQCAYYQRAHPRPSEGNPFYGPGVLTMLYANGRGIERNYNLAIRFACENPWAAEAEMELRIGHLEHLRDTHVSVTNFDLCDDGTSGLMEGACESIHQQFADEKRRKDLEAISANWPPQVKEAFQSLNAAEEAFVKARTRNEVDLSGTGRAAFALEEQGRLRDQFLINLQRFAKGDIPSASAADYTSVDQKLNDVYRHIQHAPDTAWQYGTIKSSGIRDTEVAWLKLRDAWVDFARIAYPHLSADTVRTQIARLRLHQLQSLDPKH